MAAAVPGLTSAAVGPWLSAHPGWMLGRDREVFLVRVLLGPRATGAVLAGLGLGGAVGALLALALAELAGFGLALQSVTTIFPAGYLLAGARRTHVAALLRKLGARDRTQAVVLAYEAGLVDLGRRR